MPVAVAETARVCAVRYDRAMLGHRLHVSSTDPREKWRCQKMEVVDSDRRRRPRIQMTASRPRSQARRPAARLSSLGRLKPMIKTVRDASNPKKA